MRERTEPAPAGGWKRSVDRFAGWGIGLVFGAWALRTSGAYAVVQSDAARHAMNGAFIRDLIARGNFGDALSFAREYYGHLPALSMPYHPPGFPFIEAFFFFAFGVNAFAARLAIALMVVLSGVLLFAIVKRAGGSTLIAAASTTTFLFLPESVWVGSDVMLEFPALLFVLLAFHVLEPADAGYSIRRGIVFALLAGAAVWTKQQAVFLGVTPFLYFAMAGRWRLFRTAGIWISSVMFAVLVAGVSALSIPFEGTGVSQAIPAAPGALYASYMRLFWRNLRYYTSNYYEAAGSAAVILVIAAVVGCFGRVYRRREVALYGSWILSSMAVILLIRPFTTRYLFFTYPALFALGYLGLSRIAARFAKPSPGPAVAAVGLVMAAGAFASYPYRTFFLHGPDDAARWLAEVHPRRILYCGDTDGNFVFAYRSFREGLETAIIPGDKLPSATFTREGMEQFSHDYGINYIVVEDRAAPDARRPWGALIDAPSPSMVAEKEFPVTATTDRWNGRMRIFRFANPSPHPKDILRLRMWTVGRTVDVNLGAVPKNAN